MYTMYKVKHEGHGWYMGRSQGWSVCGIELCACDIFCRQAPFSLIASHKQHSWRNDMAWFQSNKHAFSSWHLMTLVPHLPWPRSSEEPGHRAVKTFVGKGTVLSVTHPAMIVQWICQAWENCFPARRRWFIIQIRDCVPGLGRERYD